LETQGKYKYLFLIALVVLLFYSNAYRSAFLVDDFLFLGELHLSDLVKFFKGASPNMEDAPGRSLFYGDYYAKTKTYCTVDSEEFVPPPPIAAGLREFGKLESEVGIAYYRPLQLLFNSLPYQFLGDNYHLHHILNILLHILICFMVYNLIVRISGSEKMAFIATLLFAGMPIHTEAVTKIKGLADLLITIITLYTFSFAVRFFNAGKRKFYILSLLFFSIVFILKQIIITIPIVIFAYEIIIHRKLNLRIKEFFRLLIKYIPYCVVVALLLLRQLLLAGMGFRTSFNVMVGLAGFKFEFENLFSPFPLSIVFLVFLVPAFFHRNSHQNRQYLFFLVWTVVMFIPDIYVQSKWNCYISSIGFCAGISWLLVRLDDYTERAGERIKGIFYLLDGLLGISILLYLYLLWADGLGLYHSLSRWSLSFLIFFAISIKVLLYKKGASPSLLSGKALRIFQVVLVIFILAVYGKQCQANNDLLFQEGFEGDRFAKYLKKNFPDMSAGDEIYVENLSLQKVVWRHASLVYRNKAFLLYPEAFFLQREKIPLSKVGNFIIIDYNNGEPFVDDGLKEILILQDDYFRKNEVEGPLMRWTKSGGQNTLNISYRREGDGFGEGGSPPEGTHLVIETSELDLIPWQIRYLKADMMASQAKGRMEGYLCWGKDPEESLHQGNFIRFSLKPDGETHTYKFHLYKKIKWLKAGKVGRLFLYFPAVKGGVRLERFAIY